MKANILLVLVWFGQFCLAQDSIQIQIDSIFKKHDVEGCFVLLNEEDSSYFRYNKAYCDTGYLPASTFKIPHSLIALQEDLVRDTNQVLPWDGVTRSYSVWNQDQNLATAFKYSCVWVYSDFTNYIDKATYQSYLNKFNYGNNKMQGPPHLFWLAGNMRITANEQVQFISKLYRNELPVDLKHQKLVKELMLLKQTKDYTLSGKTGGANIKDGQYIMWLVGFVETEQTSYSYTLNFVCDDFNRDKNKRLLLVNEILNLLDIIN